jgi:hypothetical protein
LLKKISANDSAMMALKPKSSSAHGACSRELPHPKLARQEHLSTLVARLIQDEIRIFGATRSILPRLADIHVAPLIKGIRAKTGTLDGFQKLFWNDGIGIDVITVERCHQPVETNEFFHLFHRFLDGFTALLSAPPTASPPLCNAPPTASPFLESLAGLFGTDGDILLDAFCRIAGCQPKTTATINKLFMITILAYRTSRTSAKRPAIAAAAAIAGLTRWVRPPDPDGLQNCDWRSRHNARPAPDDQHSWPDTWNIPARATRTRRR